jgi:hypothetical protein
MFEFEMVVAFGAGAALMAMAPVVRKMGNQELGDSMGQAGRSMAKNGVKVGIVAAGAAGKVARGVAKSAAEVAESFVDLVEEAKSESSTEEISDQEVAKNGSPKTAKSATITDVTVE